MRHWGAFNPPLLRPERLIAKQNEMGNVGVMWHCAS